MKQLICQRCKKEMNTAFRTIGAYSYGPKCAEKMGLVEKKKRKRAVSNVVQDYDPRQLEIKF